MLPEVRAKNEFADRKSGYAGIFALRACLLPAMESLKNMGHVAGYADAQDNTATFA
jgi:hypothetical protein